MFRWAVISSGKIAQDFANAIRQLPGHEVSAVVSRTKENGEAFARRLCPSASCYTSIEELQQDSIDAAYVASPNQAHASQSMSLLNMKTPVLCEKPLAPTMAKVDEVISTARARETFLMEGMWTRCFPATTKARELLSNDAIGKIVGVQAEFGYDIANGCPASVRGDAESGGMTLDIGIYLVEKALLAFDDCLQSCAVAKIEEEDGVDTNVAASLKFQGGGVASLMWTGLADTPETATLIGTQGSLVFDKTAHTPPTLLLRQRKTRTDHIETRFDFPSPNDDQMHPWNYPGSICLQYEALAVERAVRAKKLEAEEWTLADSRKTHAILHEIKSKLLD